MHKIHFYNNSTILYFFLIYYCQYIFNKNFIIYFYFTTPTIKLLLQLIVCLFKIIIIKKYGHLWFK